MECAVRGFEEAVGDRDGPLVDDLAVNERVAVVVLVGEQAA
jgi:hypothetical protein